MYEIDQLEYGKVYATKAGFKTTALFKTPTTSIYRERYPFAGYLVDKLYGIEIEAIHFWDENGNYFRNSFEGRMNLGDEVDEPVPEENDEIDALYEADIKFMFDVKSEVVKARSRFTNDDLAHAMTEEFGEVIKALLDQKQKDKCTSAEIYKECVQAAAMAMRLALEGDPCFPKYQPPTIGD